MNNISDIFFDVDYTIVDFGEAQRKTLVEMKKKFGDEFVTHFDQVFHTILEGLRAKHGHWEAVPGGEKAFISVRNRIAELVPNEKPQVWSRELYAVLAGEFVRHPLTPQECMGVAETYWTGVADYSRPFTDAIDLLTWLTKQRIRYHFFSSSDFRLTYTYNAWHYDPAYSEKKKRVRIECLSEYGVRPVSISIGDPIDKPEVSFYQKILTNAEQAVGSPISPGQCAFVGDSYAGDAQAPVEKLGAAKGFWLQPGKPAYRVSDAIYSISSLQEVGTQL